MSSTATRPTPPETTAPAVVDNLQVYDPPEKFEDHDTTAGIEIVDLEILTPGCENIRLADLFAEPE